MKHNLPHVWQCVDYQSKKFLVVITPFVFKKIKFDIMGQFLEELKAKKL